MRPDTLYLRDILDATDHIARFVADVEFSGFLGDEMLRSAVLQKLIVIGEAAARVSQDLKAQCANVDWAGMVAFRNIAVHAYFSVNWGIVWQTALHDVPEVCRQVRSILEDTESSQEQ